MVQTYQHGDYIRRCLDNILGQQTSFDYEVIIGEDDSSDGTREICVEYREKYGDRIRLFLHDRKNVIYIQGKPTGRYNFLHNLNECTGKYIAFCEGDDYWDDPQKLQKQVDYLEANPDCTVCYHNARFANSKGELQNRWKIDPDRAGKSDPAEFRTRIEIPIVTSMFRRDAVVQPPQIKTVLNVDTFLMCLLCRNSEPAYLSEVKDAVAHVHDGGMWSPRGDLFRIESQIGTFNALLEYIEPEHQPTLRDMIAARHLRYARICFRKLKLIAGSSALLKYFATYRFSPMAIGGLVAGKLQNRDSVLEDEPA